MCPENESGEFGGFKTLDELKADNKSRTESMTSHAGEIDDFKAKLAIAEKAKVPSEKKTEAKAFTTKARDALDKYANDSDLDLADMDNKTHTTYIRKLTKLTLASENEQVAEDKSNSDSLRNEHYSEANHNRMKENWQRVLANHPKMTEKEKMEIVDRCEADDIYPETAVSIINAEKATAIHEKAIKEEELAKEKERLHREEHVITENVKDRKPLFARNSREWSKARRKAMIKDEDSKAVYDAMIAERKAGGQTNKKNK